MNGRFFGVFCVNYILRVRNGCFFLVGSNVCDSQGDAFSVWNSVITFSFLITKTECR